MRIICVTPMYSPALGGAEWHLKKLAEGLAARGHEVTVLTANVRNIGQLGIGACGGLALTEMLEGVRVRRFRPDGGLVGSLLECWQNLRGGYWSLSLLFRRERLDFLLGKPLLIQLIPHLLAARADVVVSTNWYWPPAYFAHVAKKLRHFTLVGVPLFHTAETWGEHPILQRMLANCDAVAVNTAYEADFVRKQAEVRVEVCGVGIDGTSFENRDGRKIRTRYGLDSHPVVGFVGRSAPNKGAMLLLQAMKIVWEWNREVRLVLAGPRAGRRKEVEAFIAGLTALERERIVMIDDFPESDKPSIYDSFDVFALPSTGESFGIAYLEAWMCGKPVIGARIGSTKCVIDEGKDGLLVSPEDPEDTARAIVALLSDDKKRELMGQQGRAKTLAQYTWDKVIDRTEKLFLELVTAASAAPAVGN